MPIRLLCTVLMLWLLAGVQGFGLHLHEHGRGSAMHSHLVTALDADHLQAHADGAVDHDDAKLGPRADLPLPDLLPLLATLVAALFFVVPTATRPRRRPSPDLASPPRSRPPGRAPPHFLAAIA